MNSDEAKKKVLRNHAGGHANHSLFWTIMSLMAVASHPEIWPRLSIRPSVRSRFQQEVLRSGAKSVRIRLVVAGRQ